tara:strand:+ start:2220 stop:3164 length:945 start_codon:yes stop_codon:yes gene_type:complete
MENEAITEEEIPQVEETMTLDDELGDIFDQANADEEPDRGSQEKTEAEPVEAPPPADAPASWSAEEKQHWPSLSAEVQSAFLRREGDWQKADSDRATQLKGYEPIAAALAPVRQSLELNGMDEGTYVRQLVAADQFLKTQPDQAIQWLAQQYGIDPGQTFSGSDEIVDPTMAPVLGEISQLKQQLGAFQAQHQQAEMASLEGQISDFAAENPHFEKVRTQMGALIQAGQAADMSAAYDMAVWANPTTRAELMAAQSAAEQAQREEETATRVKKAQRVAQTNLSSRGTAAGASPVEYANRADELADIYDKLQGAA